MIEKLSPLKMGNPLDETTEVSCLINEGAKSKVQKQIAACVAEGARLIFGGSDEGGCYLKPAVLTDVPAGSSVATDEEIFGPVFPIIEFETPEEALEIANSSIYGLSGCVFSRDMSKAFKTAAELQTGSTVINGSGNYRTIEMPFGGYKKSGIGREGILNSLDEMTQLKTMVVRNVF